MEIVSLDLTGVLDGWPLYELPTCILVPSGDFPVSCGHPRGSLRGVHLWYSVLVSRLLLLFGPAHSSPCVYPSFLQTASIKCLWGKHNCIKFIVYGNIEYKTHPFWREDVYHFLYLILLLFSLPACFFSIGQYDLRDQFCCFILSLLFLPCSYLRETKVFWSKMKYSTLI